MKTALSCITSNFLILSMISLGLPVQAAYAGIVGTDRVAISAQQQTDRERVRTFLDREDVRSELQAQGIDADTAQARVDALTSDEVKKVAGKLDTMTAGGEIIGVLFTVFVVLLITDILGFTKVFPFTRTVR